MPKDICQTKSTNKKVDLFVGRAETIKAVTTLPNWSRANSQSSTRMVHMDELAGTLAKWNVPWA